MYHLSVFVLGTCAISVFTLTLSQNNTLRCRSCSRAITLADCDRVKTCDATLEKCYMDELITDQLTVVYEGGCRSKDMCAFGIGKRKRDDKVACSSCCNFADDCNKRLCNIRDDTVNSPQCYSCDHRTSEQGEVKDPKNCVTLTVCQPNEMCYVQQTDVGGVDTFFYGCRNALQCKYLMKMAYEDHRVCVMNDTTALLPGYTWETYCIGRRGARFGNLCHSCCADGGCNYGTCEELNARLFKLADNGKFSFDTLKILP